MKIIPAMKKLSVFIIITSFSLSLYSQQGMQRQQRMEKIKAQKVAYITTAMQLTPEESEVFWPIYNEYDKKRESFERARIGKFQVQEKGISDMSDEEVEKLILDRFKREQEMTELNMVYYARFKEVLPVKKIFDLYKAEMEFRKVLLDRLQEYKGREGQGGQGKQGGQGSQGGQGGKQTDPHK